MNLEVDAKDVLNGVDINRVGAVLAGKGEDATEREREIARIVRRKLEWMRKKGYHPKEAAAHVKQLVVREAMRPQN